MPEGMEYWQYFDLDYAVRISVDHSPRFPAEVVEETEEHTITTTSWGATMRQLKGRDTTPEFLDFRIKTPDDWARAKERITPDPNRINWNQLKQDYPVWREGGAWIQGIGFFGFDATQAWIVGTERLLMALVTDPEWCFDMFEHIQDVNLKLLDLIWDEGYEFDSLFWWDDMGYKQNQFFSLSMYRDLMKPIHKRTVEWAHAKGIKAHLHSCGDIRPFVPELVDMGLDALNPLEVKAGMDPIALKEQYGDRLVLHGGLNAVLWGDQEAVEADIKEKLPMLMEAGGYIFSPDHSVHSDVSLDGFRRITDLAKQLGSY